MLLQLPGVGVALWSDDVALRNTVERRELLMRLEILILPLRWDEV
jgi:hypothetical protein